MDLYHAARRELEEEHAMRAASAEAYRRRRHEVREILIVAGLPHIDALECLFPHEQQTPVVFRMPPRRNVARDIEAALAVLQAVGIVPDRLQPGDTLLQAEVTKIGNSSFQLVNGLVGTAKPSAQLAPETRK
jgi:hypothetical protein